MTAETTPSEIARRGEVRRVGSERFDQVAHLLAEAYREDPVVTWTLGGADRALDDDAHLRYWRAVLEGLGPGSEVHATYDVDAVALWRPTPPATGAAVEGYDLVALAVAVASRGRGLSLRVRRPMVDRADRRGLVLTARGVSARATALTSVGGTVAVGSERLGPDGPVVVLYRRAPVAR